MNAARRTFGAKTLAGEYYTSRDVYAAEAERIFRRSWLCVARESEIAAPGDYLLVELDGENLILLRDQNGKARCYYNVCRHRGTRLCEQAQGNVGRALACPYHAWTYDLEGRLVAAPNMRDVEGFRLADYPLKAVAAATWEGFVIINLSDSPAPFEVVFEPLIGRFRSWRLAELISVRKLAYVVNANWKLIFQNYNECYHCPRVHPCLNALTPFKSAANDLEEGRFLGGPMLLAEGVETMSRDGRLCGDIFPDLVAEDRRRVYYFSIFPTLFLSPHPDCVLVHRIERVSIGATRVVCEFLFPPSSTAKPDFDPRPAVEFWDEVNRQDWRVCELSQQGVTSRAYEPAPYSHLESIVAAFDRCYLRELERI
jgi:Rieske 2Fe-2S family protein